MTDLHYLGLVELGERIKKRELSALEATQAQLDRIHTLDGQLKSYAAVASEQALEAAKKADQEIWRPGQFLLVIDQMASKQPRTYRQWFHFHDNLEVEREGSMLKAELGSGRTLFVNQLWKSPSMELHRGETKPRIQGWVSPAYNVKVPRHSIAFRQKAANVTFATLFSNGPVANARITGDAGALTLRFSVGGTRTAFRFSPSQKDPVALIGE